MSTTTAWSLGWFNIAVQALVVLAEKDGACPSGAIARELKAHEVFLRRVLAQLARVQIVSAREGRHGGYCLARPIQHITLAEVYKAVKSAGVVEEPVADNGLPLNVQAALDEVGIEAERCLLTVLDHYTIAQIIERAAAFSPEA